jgi:iron(III) transport system substrate-binding protein
MHISRFGLAAVYALGMVFSAATHVQAQAPSWASAEQIAAAKSEGDLTVYGSMNEQEALPLWKLFEDSTGIKVNYVRSSDTGLLSRIALEARAQQKTWDIVVTTAVSKLPAEFLAPIDLPAAKQIIPQAVDPAKRWYGVYANYNSPSYNTKLINADQLPKTYEDFLKHPEWAGKVGMDPNDSQWVYAMFQYYGEDKARKLIKDLMQTLKPVHVDGHLALARAVGLGEYAITLNNYSNLTINVKLAGSPTDYWGMDPMAIFFGQMGVSVRAAHPKSALLAANFLISKEAQTQMTTQGRLPVRPDVTPNPPDAITKHGDRKIITIVLSNDDEKKWSKITQELLNPK